MFVIEIGKKINQILFFYINPSYLDYFRSFFNPNCYQKNKVALQAISLSEASAFTRFNSPHSQRKLKYANPSKEAFCFPPER